MTRTRKTPDTDLASVVEEFRRHLWLPDPGTVYVTLATVAANRLPGDPVWTLLVGASSSGKSETINALDRLPEHYAVSTFSEAGLVSGSSDGTPGLLIQIGESGLLVFKDLTTILSKHKADRDGVLGCLREVYDGSYTRRLGNKGGEKKWEGRLGLIAAVTEMIDDYDLGQLGERSSATACRPRAPMTPWRPGAWSSTPFTCSGRVGVTCQSHGTTLVASSMGPPRAHVSQPA
jgi:hypothetical protein